MLLYIGAFFPSVQIFFAYTQQYAKSAKDWLEDSKRLSVQGRKSMPQAHLRQDPCLSWAGFEAVCQDFHIIATPVSSIVGPASRHPRPQANPHPTHQPKAGPGGSASKTTRYPDSPTRVFSVEAPSSGLLSAVQICIAFVSACTHRSMVASFPNDGQSDGIASGDNARRDNTPRGGSAEEKRLSCAEEDAAFWQVSV